MRLAVAASDSAVTLSPLAQCGICFLSAPRNTAHHYADGKRRLLADCYEIPVAIATQQQRAHTPTRTCALGLTPGKEAAAASDRRRRDGKLFGRSPCDGSRVGDDVDQAATVLPVEPGGIAVGRVHAHRLSCRPARGPDALKRRPEHRVLGIQLAAERVGQVTGPDVDAVDARHTER